VNVKKLAGLSAVCLSVTLLTGCGEVARSGRSPSQAVITALEGASGAENGELSGTLRSDVITVVDQETGRTSIFDDPGSVTMRLILKDPGVPGSPSTPSALNAVTFNRYRVTYRRADGRNTPGVDVPYPLESAVTFTVPEGGEATAGFTLVRHTAKMEAPLAALTSSSVIISTLADVTFYGRDQAGNEVSVTGTIGIFFGNFGDPE
jgi:hypothetical protein